MGIESTELYENRKEKLLWYVNLFILTDNLIYLAEAKYIFDSILQTENLSKEDLKKLKRGMSCRDIIDLEI